MKRFHVFLSPEDGALTLVSHQNVNFMDYEERLTEIYKGNKRACLQFIEDYQDENLIPDDAFIVHEIN